MPSRSDDQASRENNGNEFAMAMKTRLEQARAAGQSVEKIQQLALELGREESGRRATGVVTQVRSWWSGFRTFLMVGVMACVLAIGLAWFVEHRYAEPLCDVYAKEHHFSYRHLNYPSGGHSTNAGSARCVFADSSGHEQSISLAKLEPNFINDLMVSIALGIEFTIPAFFVLVALILAAVRRVTKA